MDKIIMNAFRDLDTISIIVIVWSVVALVAAVVLAIDWPTHPWRK